MMAAILLNLIDIFVSTLLCSLTGPARSCMAYFTISTDKFASVGEQICQ